MTDAIVVDVDVQNPGQFFACCGLLELADRAWFGAEGWFEGRTFRISATRPDTGGELEALIRQLQAAPLVPSDPEDTTASPLMLGEPFTLWLDWWSHPRSGVERLKTWAGRQKGPLIAAALRAAIPAGAGRGLLDAASVVRDPEDSTTTIQSFCLDARRGASSSPLDVGFSADPLKLSTATFPATELLALVGLQRVRPRLGRHVRAFRYSTWRTPLMPELAALVGGAGYPALAETTLEFELVFRSKYLKTFGPATAL